MKFAKRMERMQASEIRELLKLTAQPDIISFAGGLPAPELFPQPARAVTPIAAHNKILTSFFFISSLPPRI